MKKKYSILTGILFLTTILITHQNCTESEFSEMPKALMMLKMASRDIEGKSVSDIKAMYYDANSYRDYVIGYTVLYSSSSAKFGSEICIDAELNNFSNCFDLWEQAGEDCETYEGVEYCYPTYAGNENIASIEIADMNADGKEDIILFGVGKSNILLNDGMGSRGKPKYIRKQFGNANAYHIGTVLKFDNNSQPDIAYVELTTRMGTPITSHLKVIYDGQTELLPKQYTLPNATAFLAPVMPESPHTMIAVELKGVNLDQDSNEEIFIKNQYNVNHYTAKFVSVNNVKVGEVETNNRDFYNDPKMQIIDINGDSKQDVLVPSLSEYTEPTSLTSVFLSNGSFSNTTWNFDLSEIRVEWQTIRNQKILDLNMDGILDAVAIRNSGLGHLEFLVSLGRLDENMQLVFMTPRTFHITDEEDLANNYMPILILNLDGNGYSDFVVGTKKGLRIYTVSYR